MQNCKNHSNNYFESKSLLLGEPTCIKCGAYSITYQVEYKSPIYSCTGCGNKD